LQVEESFMFKLNILQIKLYSRKMYIFPYHLDNVMVPFRNGQLTSLKTVCILKQHVKRNRKFPIQTCARIGAFAEEFKML